METQYQLSNNSIRNIFANSLTTSFTATSKRDIMFSEKLNMMCSAQGFYSSKSLFYKAFYHFNASQSSLPHRDDGSHRRRQQPHGRNDGRSSSSDWGSFQVIRKANYNELPLRAWFDCLAIMNWLRHELRCGAWGNSIHGATNCKAISREIMTRKRQFMQSKIANHQ